MTVLRRWWTKKYRLPITSEHWKNAFKDELLAEFLEDLIDDDEEYARELRLKHLGYEVAPSGDPIIDLWEKQIAEGIVPDLDYDEPENAKLRDERIRKMARRYYSEYGRSSLFKAPAPEDSLSIEDIESKREGWGPDMRQYGVPDEADIMFDRSGYPLGSGDLNPEAFDKLTEMARDGGFKSLDLDTIEQFIDVGKMFKK